MSVFIEMPGNPDRNCAAGIPLPPSGLTLPPEGYVRIRQLLAPNGPIPIARSTLWQWVKDGRFPLPQKLSPRVTAWRVEDVRAFLQREHAWPGPKAAA